jgi:pyrroline-5-carboxylate reductase
MTKIAVVGAGKIGQALIDGLLAAGERGSDILCTVRSADKADALVGKGVQVVSNAEAAKQADIVIIAVKPQDIDPVLLDLGELNSDAVVVSMCAGLHTALFESKLPAGTPVVRVMPNTPMLVGEAMSVMSAGAHATQEHLDAVAAVLAHVGKVTTVPEGHEKRCQDSQNTVNNSGQRPSGPLRS